MRNTFVETANYRNLTASLTTLNDRGAVEACIVVVDGKPGLGKTHAMSRWGTQTGSIYVRAQEGWDYSWFINEVLAELAILPSRTKRARFQQLIDGLKQRQERADLEGKMFGWIVDECDLVSNRTEIMETIRGISDLSRIPTILVGMGKLRDNLRRFPQIESRAPRKVSFTPADLADVKALMVGRCEVKVAPDLCEFVHRVSKGFNREIMDAIRHIERFGMRGEAGPAGISMADMAGQVIMNDRDTGNPIIVPRAA